MAKHQPIDMFFHILQKGGKRRAGVENLGGRQQEYKENQHAAGVQII